MKIKIKEKHFSKISMKQKKLSFKKSPSYEKITNYEKMPQKKKNYIKIKIKKS